MNFKTGILCFFLAFQLGCQKSAAVDKNSTTQQPKRDTRVQALLDKTLQNIVFVEGGTFMMGDQKHEFVDKDGRTYHAFFTHYRDNKPAHEVTLDSYHIGKYEVTYGEFDIFTEVTGREPTLKKLIGQPWRQGNYPAGVTWFDAKAYCGWLGEISCLPFDLPTEAQWEYAARSRGELVKFATDNGEIERNRNYPNSTRLPIEVGSFPPNPLGLHDMSGNLFEWVNDWYDPEYYQHSPGHSPHGPKEGEKKIIRGGGFLESPNGSNVYIRGKVTPKEEAYIATGFRCVLNQTEPLPTRSFKSSQP